MSSSLGGLSGRQLLSIHMLCLILSIAYSSYLKIQERIYRKYFDQWMSDPSPEPKPYQMALRDLNMETSLRVFCGNYLPDAAAKEISDKYWLITLALELVNFPLALPGTKVYNAIKARKVAMKWFEFTAAASKKRMATGAEPECLTDGWIKAMMDARQYEAEGKNSGEAKPMLIREYSVSLPYLVKQDSH